MNSFNLNFLNASEPSMQASKWLNVQALINNEELSSLFNVLESFDIYKLGSVMPVYEGLIKKNTFIDIYHEYIKGIKNGKMLEESCYKPLFTSAITATTDCLFAVKVGSDKQLIKVSKPVIQMQPHSMDFSMHDFTFRSMVFGSKCISWGLQFSFPQLYLDPLMKTAVSVKDEIIFPNLRLFRMLQKWMRYHTIPTPFIIQNKKINASIRLGKNCLEWINNHPHLKEKNILVKN